jgi:hypothetical protein
MIEITIFPMTNKPDGSAELCEPRVDPDSYDILAQDDDGEVLAETDDLPTYEEAVAAVEKYLLEYPGADVNYGDF